MNFPRGRHVFAPLYSRNRQRKTFDVTLVIQNKLPGCHCERHNSKEERRFIVVFYPSQKKVDKYQNQPKRIHDRTFWHIFFHNRINISEPKPETHVSQLPEERSPKICAILLERGTGDAHNVAKIVDSQLKPATVSSE